MSTVVDLSKAAETVVPSAAVTRPPVIGLFGLFGSGTSAATMARWPRWSPSCAAHSTRRPPRLFLRWPGGDTEALRRRDIPFGGARGHGRASCRPASAQNPRRRASSWRGRSGHRRDGRAWNRYARRLRERAAGHPDRHTHLVSRRARQSRAHLVHERRSRADRASVEPAAHDRRRPPRAASLSRPVLAPLHGSRRDRHQERADRA